MVVVVFKLKSLSPAQGTDLPFSHKGVVSFTHEQNIICSKTHLVGTTHKQTIICRSHGGLLANEKEGKIH